jgi:glycosyltransferase involved in cell wall biosynthesis
LLPKGHKSPAEAAALPPRIALFLPSLAGGGAEHVMLELGQYFSALGFRCDLVLGTRAGDLSERVPINLRVVDLGARKTWRAIGTLRTYLIREKPDVLLSSVLAANVAAIIASRRLPYPIRCYLREANTTYQDSTVGSPIRTFINRLAVRVLYPHADGIIAVADNVQQELVRRFSVDARRIQVIPNPLTLPAATSPTIGRAQAEFRKPYLVTCGRLEPQKDPETLLRAFALIRLKHSVQLVILGEGSMRMKLNDLAERLGIAEHVHMPGFRPDVFTIFSNASAFIHTSRFEGFPNVIAQALAARCQVVATDCPGATRLILDEGRYGHLVPIGDHGAIANAVDLILSGAIAYPDSRRYLDQFCLESVGNRYLEAMDLKSPLSGA